MIIKLTQSNHAQIKQQYFQKMNNQFQSQGFFLALRNYLEIVFKTGLNHGERTKSKTLNKKRNIDHLSISATIIHYLFLGAKAPLHLVRLIN